MSETIKSPTSRNALRKSKNVAAGALAFLAMGGTPEAANANGAKPYSGGGVPAPYNAGGGVRAPYNLEDKKLTAEQMVRRTASLLARRFLAQYREQANQERPNAQLKLLDQNEAGTEVELRLRKGVPLEARVAVYDMSATMQRRNGKLLPSTANQVTIMFTEYPDKAGKSLPSEDEFGVTSYYLSLQKGPDGSDKDRLSEWSVQQNSVNSEGAGLIESMYTGQPGSFKRGGFEDISRVAFHALDLEEAGHPMINSSSK